MDCKVWQEKWQHMVSDVQQLGKGLIHEALTQLEDGRAQMVSTYHAVCGATLSPRMAVKVCPVKVRNWPVH